MELEKVLITYQQEEEELQDRNLWYRAIIIGKKVPKEVECPCGCGYFVYVDKKRSYVIGGKKWWEREK
jgi:hypothetical protein